MYEWLNNNFDVRACWDFRTGSAYELKNGIAPTVVGSPRMVPGDGLVYPSTGTTNVHYGDILPLNTSQPFTWIWKVSTFNNWNNSPWSSILNKNGSTNNFYLVHIASTGITIQLNNATDRLDISSFPSKRNSNICIIFAYNGGLKASGCSMFVDGSSKAFSVDNDSLTPAILGSTANFNLGYTGGNLSKSTCFKHFSWLNQAVTPAQASAIYEKLNSQQPVTHRPTRAYSIPSPTMTPAEYTAKGIVFDTDMQIVNGKVRDLTGNGRDGTPSGQLDRIKGEATRLDKTSVILPSEQTIFGTNNWTCSFYGTLGKAATTTCPLFWAAPLVAPQYVGYSNIGRLIVSTRNASLVQRTLTSTKDVVVPGRYDHIAMTRELVGSDLRLKIYINGTLNASQTWIGEGVENVASSTPTFSNYYGTYAPAIISSFRWQANTAITASEARAEYLAGNKILFDGRLPKDGSCPVSLTSIGGAGAQIPGTPYKVGDYGNIQAKVIEDAPTNGVPGKRWISNATAGIAYAEHKQTAYGSWLFEVKFTGAIGTSIAFIADKKGVNNPAGPNVNGYQLSFATGQVSLNKLTAGSIASLFAAKATLTSNTPYSVWITRDFTSKFTIWIKGGIYTSWTLLPAATGANPVTDATYTSTKYIATYLNITCLLGDIVHYSC